MTDPASVELTVFGRPGPQGSKTSYGKGRMVESSKRVKPWRDAVVTVGLEVMAGRAPLDGPLVVSMVFTLPKPKSAPKSRRTWPDRTPDLSKLARSTEDALTDCGVIADDARIVRYEPLAKTYPLEDADALPLPGVRITVRQVVE